MAIEMNYQSLVKTDKSDTLWLTSGVVLYRGLAHLVTVLKPLLIMQVREYAMSQGDAHLRDALTATTPTARAMMEKIGNGLHRWAQNDCDFPEVSEPFQAYSLYVASRAKMGILEVTPDNYEEYIERMLAHAMPARKSIAPTFLLTDTEKPQLFVTSEMDILSRYAAKHVETQVVKRKELLSLFDEIVKNFHLAHKVKKKNRTTMEIQ